MRVDPHTGTIEILPLSVRAHVATVDAEKRTVELVFTTGAPVERWDWMSGKRYLEKLSLNAAHIRLERLNAGAPLLNAHSAYSLEDQIGVVEPDSIRLTAKEGRATVRFSRRPAVEPIWGDVQDGVIRSVSVGYRVYKFEEDQGKGTNAIPIRTAIDWEPFEISMVPMPADIGAHVRGGKPGDVTDPTFLARLNACEVVPRSHQDDEDRNRSLRLLILRAHAAEAPGFARV